MYNNQCRIKLLKKFHDTSQMITNHDCFLIVQICKLVISDNKKISREIESGMSL